MIRTFLLLFVAFIFNSTSIFSQSTDFDSPDGEAIIDTKTFSGYEHAQKLATLLSVDPGDSIEGDYVKESAFCQNGQTFLSCNFVTRNLSVIDWQSQIPIADIPLNGNPAYVKAQGNTAVVTLPLDDSTVIIDLLTKSVSASIYTPGEPNHIQLDELNNRAFISSIDSQYCYVIDLNTNTLIQTIDSFYSGLQTFSFITSNNRSDFDHYDFIASKDGSKLIAIAPGGSGISIHDVASGNIDTTYTQISNPFAFGMSDTLRAFVLNNGPIPAIYRIDLGTLSMDSISLSGLSIFSLCRGMAVDAVGEKVILSMGGGMVRADFSSMNYAPVTSNTVFWLDHSYDHQYAVGGGFYTQVVDINSGTTSGNYTGLSQSRGAVSDSGYHFAGIDPLRKEYFHSFDFSAGGVSKIGDIATGSAQEADAPYRIAFSDDGKKILVANQLSRSASIINADSAKLEALVSGMATGSFGCAITSDGKYGLIADYEGFAIHVIHMASGQLVASPTVGDRPSIIRIAPGDTLALVTNTRGNTVSFVRLDSANSASTGSLYVGVIGVSWTNQGIFSDLQIPSTGHHALLATSFDDDIKVINMLQQNITLTLPTGDFPTQIAVSDNGQFAMVINKNANSVSFLNVQGAFTSVLNVANTGNNPTRITYHSMLNQFVVTCSGDKTVQYFSGTTGNLINTENFGPNYTPLQVLSLKSGKLAYLLAASGTATSNVLRVDGIDYPLPARPCYMAASKNSEKLAIAMSGPDYIAIFEGDSLIIGNTVFPQEKSGIRIYPNPTHDFISFDNISELHGYEYFISDLTGSVLKRGVLDRNKNQIDLRNLNPGIYIFKTSKREISDGQYFIKE